MALQEQIILRECTYKTSRSGGKGGQNVNKVSTKVELIFNIEGTEAFTPDEKALLLEKLSVKLDSGNNLHVISQESRSQLLNKETAVNKLFSVLEKALAVQKKRKPTRIPKSVKLKRLSDKSALAGKKELRRKVDDN